MKPADEQRMDGFFATVAFAGGIDQHWRTDPSSSTSEDEPDYDRSRGYAEESIDYAQIGRTLDRLEREATDALHQELVRVRDLLGERLKEPGVRPQYLVTLPRRAELEREIEAMLQRAWDAGHAAEVRAIRQYSGTSFVPREAVKWLRDAAFWITDVLSDGLLSEAQRILVAGIKNGAATSEMMRELFESFVPYLGGEVGGEVVTAHRLETIVRTNTTTAYNHGRLTQILDPKLARFMDGVRYSAILDTRTTEVCRLLHEKIFLLPAGAKDRKLDPTPAADIEALLPPRHYNCRSVVSGITVGAPLDPAQIITAAEIAKAKELSGAGFMQRGPFARYGG